MRHWIRVMTIHIPTCLGVLMKNIILIYETMNVLTVLMIAVESKPLLFSPSFHFISFFLFKDIHKQFIIRLESRFFPSHLTKVGVEEILLWKLDADPLYLPLFPLLLFLCVKNRFSLCILRRIASGKKSFF